MRLSDGEMRPGVILEVLDSKGVIKASVPGLFSAQDIDVLPPIFPFAMGGSNTYSSPNVGDECWVLFFVNNPEQLYWFRKDNFSTNNGSLNKGGLKTATGKSSASIQEQKNVEVISSRESGMGWATIYFADGSGWIIQNQDAILQLDRDGNIILTNGQPHCTLEINEDGISLGQSGGSAHPACYGDKAADLFENIIGTLREVATTCQSSPYTIAIGTAITKSLAKYENDAEAIQSEYVSID